MPEDTKPGSKEELLSKVKYTYVGAAQIQTNTMDVRIAFGDRLPPNGTIDPLFGITMSHGHAKEFLKALENNIANFEKLKSQIAQNLPFNPNEVKTYEIVQGKEGISAVKLTMKDGSTKSIQGADLTEGVRSFIRGLSPQTPKPS